jgi:hypothetical protein
MPRLSANQSAPRTSRSANRNSRRLKRPTWARARAKTDPFRGIALAAVFVLLFAGVASQAFAEAAGQRTSAKSLDEQVQEIKTDVLAIATELNNLEEKLLYPSNTQVAVFVSLAEGESIDVDAAKISIDGEVVAQHIYSFKEVEALEKGGVQRIYTGNIQTGRHQLDVSVSGKRGAGKDFELLGSFAFTKEVDPKLVGITLSTSSVGSTSIEIEDW